MTDRAESFRLLRMPAATLHALRRAIGSPAGEADPAVLLREVGLSSGAALYELLGGWLADAEGGSPEPENLEVDEFWGKVAEFFSQLGWGGLEHERIHPGVVSLTSMDWFESAGEESSRPSCHLTTGALADLMKRIAGVDLAVMEVECRGSGADVCRFLVGSAEALDGVYEGLRRGVRVPEALEQLA
jgi:predicted hydrocarbon binding protein